MSSIDSSPAEQSSSDATNEDALREEMQLASGVQRLGRMAAARSVNRNLRNEDAAVAENIRRHEDEFFGEQSSSQPLRGDEEMDVMAGRDVHVYHSQTPPHQPQPTNAPNAPDPRDNPVAAVAAVADARPAGGMTALQKAGVGAALVAAGALPAAIATYALTPSVEKAPPAAVAPEKPSEPHDHESGDQHPQQQSSTTVVQPQTITIQPKESEWEFGLLPP